jgi:hypothetical protein
MKKKVNNNCINIIIFTILTINMLVYNIIEASDTMIFKDNNKANIITEERLLFIRPPSLIITMKADGTDEKIIDNNAASFSISPDSRWMIVSSANSAYKTRRECRLYDIKKGFVHTIIFPEGHWIWEHCWWAEDSEKLYVYSGVDYYGEPFSLPLTLNDPSTIDKVMSYDIFAHNFSIKDYKGNLLKVEDFIVNERPKEKMEFISPDKKHILKWIDSELFLISYQDSQKRLIFQKDPSKFGSDISISELAWSSDSEYFVVSMMKSGLWKEVFWGIDEILSEKLKKRSKSKEKIYIVKRDNLKWKEITDGSFPFWFKKFPLSFYNAESYPNK